MLGNRGKFSAGKLWSGRRLPIAKTLRRQRPRKKAEMCVTDSRGELIASCPVIGRNPRRGVSLLLSINRGGPRLKRRRVITLMVTAKPLYPASVASLFYSDYNIWPL